jgi:hypothetical protein
VTVQLAYAVAGDGRLVHVDSVPRGDACGCTCPECAQPLRSKQGEERDWHFAHRGDAVCGGALESMLHRLAKQMLADSKEVLLPPLVARVGSWFRTLSPERRFVAEVALVEKAVATEADGPIRPDVRLVAGDIQLGVEIYVTHAVDAAKLEKLKQQGLATVEIDLSRYSRKGTPERLELDRAPRRWLYSPRKEAAEAKMREALERQRLERVEQQRLAAEAEAERQRLAQEKYDAEMAAIAERQRLAEAELQRIREERRAAEMAEYAAAAAALAERVRLADEQQRARQERQAAEREQQRQAREAAEQERVAREREARRERQWHLHVWLSPTGPVPCIPTGVEWGPVHEIGLRPPHRVEIKTRDGQRHEIDYAALAKAAESTGG